MKRWVQALAAAAVIGVAAGAEAAKLSLGDPAPPLNVAGFVKGEPVKSLERGKAYVVEFWATWCGPCRATIPHLSKLQKKHPEITFIGVSVWENDQDAVRPFVNEMGDKMAYRVAMDRVEGNRGAMAESWMVAAGQGGIPTAFIVNKEGRIAWIGHPASMDIPLAKIAAGTWDLAVAVEKQKRAAATQSKLSSLESELRVAQASGDPLAIQKVLDKAIAEEPGLEEMVGIFKFRNLLLQVGDKEKAVAYGTRLVKEVYQDDPQRLNALAWELVAPNAPEATPALAKLALAAALRADKLTGGRDGAIADTLAKALYDSGDVTGAVEAQERAVRLMKEEGATDAEVLERLEMYRKAASKVPAAGS